DGDLYNELSDDFISSYQARINVNTNHPWAPNLLLDTQLQQDPWVPHDTNIVYDLCRAFPYLSLTEHPNKEDYIARWLSPVYLNCSLGHAENANQFTHYRYLTGSFGLTKNIRALQLYSGTLGAILTNSSNNNWFHYSLIDASDWLKANNYFFRQFNQILSSINNIHPQANFPTAQLIDNETNIIPSIASLQN
ncbi:37861_t:CDS:2, partial [Gigaspora margarita]